MITPKAMILAAGRGQRMGDITTKIPKPLVELCGKPLLVHTIEKLSLAGIKEIVINVSWLGSKIVEAIGDGSNYGVSIEYSNEGYERLGTGGGVKRCIKKLGQNPFWLINADVLTDFKIDINQTLAPNLNGHLILVDNPPHHPLGDFDLFKGVVKKRSGQNPFTFSGISFLRPSLFDQENRKIFPLEPILFKEALALKITGEYHKKLWIDVGTPERLVEGRKLLAC